MTRTIAAAFYRARWSALFRLLYGRWHGPQSYIEGVHAARLVAGMAPREAEWAGKIAVGLRELSDDLRAPFPVPAEAMTASGIYGLMLVHEAAGELDLAEGMEAAGIPEPDPTAAFPPQKTSRFGNSRGRLAMRQYRLWRLGLVKEQTLDILEQYLVVDRRKVGRVHLDNSAADG